MTDKSASESVSTAVKPEVYVVVLNWNGWQDTIECLESLLDLDAKIYRLVVVDNGSTDGSLEKISSWATAMSAELDENATSQAHHRAPVEVVTYSRDVAESGGDEKEEQRLRSLSSDQSIVVIHIGENIGFAAGANVGIRYAISLRGKYVWLLNNDATVMPDSLGNMIGALSGSSSAAAATPQIRYYDRRETIWNCGGDVTWLGSRRYHYANRNISAVPQTGIKFISFATGCSLLIKVAVLEEYGPLTERFFFGEEDFEFAIRMRRAKRSMICVFDAIVYHKVGRSIDTSDTNTLVGKIYINYLNRFINMRGYWSTPVWWSWRLAYCFYIVPMLKLRYRLALSSSLRLVRSLLTDSSALDRVDRKTFSDALGRDFS